MNIQYLIKAGCYVTAALGLHLLLIFLWDVSNTKTRIVETTLNKYRAQAAKADVVFLGDSHILYGVDVRHNSHLFNLAQRGENYTQHYYKLKKLIDDGVFRAKYVVLPFNISSFSDYRDTSIAPENEWASLVDFWELAQITGRYKYFVPVVLRTQLPYLGTGVDIMKNAVKQIHKGKRIDPYPEDAFEPGLGDWSKIPKQEQLTQTKVRVEQNQFRNHKNNNLFLSKTMLTYFTKTVQMLEKNGAKVIGIRYPMTKEYIDVLKAYMSIDDMWAMIEKEVVSKFNVPVLDFMDLMIDEPNKFFDMDHLNPSGAKKLGLVIENSLKDMKIIP